MAQASKFFIQPLHHMCVIRSSHPEIKVRHTNQNLEIYVSREM
jgi:hypothetical protein